MWTGTRIGKAETIVITTPVRIASLMELELRDSDTQAHVCLSGQPAAGQTLTPIVHVLCGMARLMRKSSANGRAAQQHMGRDIP